MNMHNHIFSVINVPERNLENRRLSSLRQLLERGVGELTWQSYGVDEYIEVASQTLQQSYVVVAGMKANVERITHILDDWERKPLFTRNMQVCTFIHICMHRRIHICVHVVFVGMYVCV